MRYLFILLVGLLAWLGPETASAQSFVYRPNNPSFGGTNNFNYSTLLNMAQLQDKTKAPTAPQRITLSAQTSDIDNFTRSLQNALLGRISTQLTNQIIGEQFGEGGSLKPGTYTFGAFQVNVANGINGVVITITDGKGGQSAITIPDFSFFHSLIHMNYHHLFSARNRVGLLAGSLLFLQGCAGFFHQPQRFRNARLGEETPVTLELRSLPTPRERVVAAVYKFRDQTGQYKLAETGSTFNTVVSQGTTNILLKALDDSGWFTTIERENVGNLLNERKIIRSSMAQFKSEAENLPPLLFAGVILEGGIVSYDANVITGGAGVQYFGAGAANQYRQDRVTVYLRAVATKSGKILKTVYTSKSILSQSVTASLYRYVRYKRLLEVETGYTTNEPSQMAVTEAIEKAVHALVLEGIKDGLWLADDKTAAKAKEQLTAYEAEKNDIQNVNVFGVRDEVDPSRLTLQPFGSAWRYAGDYPTRGASLGYGLRAEWYPKPQIGLQAEVGLGSLVSEGRFQRSLMNYNLNLLYRMSPRQRTTPVFLLGGGMVMGRSSEAFGNQTRRFGQLNGGIGLERTLNGNIGLRGMVQYHQLLTDALDGVTNGQFYDYYLSGSLGVSFYIGRSSVAKVAKLPK